MAESLNIYPNYPSLCIPRVFSSINELRIKKIFEDLNVGELKNIDMVEKRADNGTMYYRVFIHFKTWFNNDTAIQARKQLIEGKEIKIIYDDPWFWKVSAYRPSTHPKPRPYVKPRQNAPPSIVLYDERTPERIPQHPQQRPVKQVPLKQRPATHRSETTPQYINRLTSQCKPSSVEKENRKSRTVKQEIEEERDV